MPTLMTKGDSGTSFADVPAQYNGGTITLADLEGLTLQGLESNGLEVSKERDGKSIPVLGVKILTRAGVRAPLLNIAQANDVSPDAVVRALAESVGGVVYEDFVGYDRSIEALTQAVHDYANGEKRVNLYAMLHDGKPRMMNGESLTPSALAGRLATLAREKAKEDPAYRARIQGKPDAGAGLRLCGFKTTRDNWTTAEVLEQARKLWPRDAVKRAYAGEETLTTLPEVKKLHNRWYEALRTRGIQKTLARVYPKLFPDLHTMVRSPTSPVSPADPVTLEEEIRTRYADGRPVSVGTEHGSPRDRIFASRVRSRRTAPTTSEDGLVLPNHNAVVCHYGRLKPEDVNGLHKMQETVGTLAEMYLEFVFGMTQRIGPDGAWYQNGWAKNFGPWLRDFYPERHITNDEQTVVPDFMLVSGKGNEAYRWKKTAAEVKTGSSKNGLSLVGKYAGLFSVEINKREYPIADHVAVLMMGDGAVERARSPLEDDGWRVVAGERAVDYVEKTFKRLCERPWYTQVEKAIPGVHDPTTLVDLFKDLVFTNRLTRPARQQEVVFADEQIRRLLAYDWKQPKQQPIY